jgi:hypothetical protein
MYADPSLIRELVVKIRLNDQESNLIDAWVNYTGQQKAVLLREMLLEQAQRNLMSDTQSTEVPQLALFQA